MLSDNQTKSILKTKNILKIKAYSRPMLTQNQSLLKTKTQE